MQTWLVWPPTSRLLNGWELFDVSVKSVARKKMMNRAIFLTPLLRRPDLVFCADRCSINWEECFILILIQSLYTWPAFFTLFPLFAASSFHRMDVTTTATTSWWWTPREKVTFTPCPDICMYDATVFSIPELLYMMSLSLRTPLSVFDAIKTHAWSLESRFTWFSLHVPVFKYIFYSFISQFGSQDYCLWQSSSLLRIVSPTPGADVSQC